MRACEITQRRCLGRGGLGCRPLCYVLLGYLFRVRTVVETRGKKEKTQREEHTNNSRKKRIIRIFPLRPQERIHLLRRTSALQLLPVQLRLLDLLHAHAPLHGQLRTPEVPAPTTTRNQIGHTRTLLRKRPCMNRLPKKLLAEPHHLQQAHAHDGRFGIVAPPAPVDEAGRQRDDVLEGAAQGHAGDVGDHAHVEIRAVEQRFEDRVIERRVIGRERLEACFAHAAQRIFMSAVRGRDG